MKHKTMVRSGLIPGLLLFLICFVASDTRVSATDTCTNAVFMPVFTALQAKTQVPLRLPSVLAGEYDVALYSKVHAVGPTHYLVRIGQNCERSYCPYGAVSGRKISTRTNRPRGGVVELAGGVRGYFIDGSKRLTDSTITWDEGEYRYTISIYAAEPTALINIANSARACNRSESPASAGG